MCAAVARAQGPLVARPVNSTRTPQPAMISHAPWLAGTNPVRSGPCRAEATTDPVSATPSDPPTWRLVEATAAATPAWARGMPETAVLLIGGFTMPLPMPKAR